MVLWEVTTEYFGRKRKVEIVSAATEREARKKGRVSNSIYPVCAVMCRRIG